MRRIQSSGPGVLCKPFIITLTITLLTGLSVAQGETFGGFEIDGNLTNDLTGTLVDWDTVTNLVVDGVDELFGQEDDSFNNIKENTIPDNFDDKRDIPTVEVTTGGIPPNKSDFTRFYVANQNFSGDEFIYLAWLRTLDSGSATMDFELNQSNDVYLETQLPVRSVGDLLITYDFGGSGNVIISFRKWEGIQWGTEMDLSESGFAEGAINTTSVLDPILDEMLSPNTFGELAINLTGSGIIPANECINFGKAYVKSRSSNSFRSSMKDFVAPIDINIGNCGFEVDKTGDTLGKVGDPVNYTFTITNTSNPGATDLLVSDVSDSLLGDLLDPTNSHVINISESIATNGVLEQGEVWTIEASRVVLEDDPDPLPNTLTASFTDGVDFTLTRSDDHEVNLFQPDFRIVKDGDVLSKVGDQVTYTYTITNLSSEDSPDLILFNLSDTHLDDLQAHAKDTELDQLSFQESNSFDVVYIIQEGDADPLTNAVTALYGVDGFPNEITRMDDHSVNLFQPAVAIDLSGDGLSKIGDEINYIITVNNNSSDDSPNLVGTVMDPYDDSVTNINLAPGEQYIENGSYTILNSDTDLFTRTASVNVSPEGFPNVLERIEGHTVNLFQPSIMVYKDGSVDAASIGEDVIYTIVIENTSSEDTPDLINPVIDDSLLGDLLDRTNAFVTSSNADGVLSTGETWTIKTIRQIALSDLDPLVNAVMVIFNPEGFPNRIIGNDGHTVDILYPLLEIVKTPDDEIIRPGDTATFTVVVSNVGDGRAIDVQLGDILPTPIPQAGDLTWTFDVEPREEFANGETNTFELGNLDAGDTFTVLVSAAIPTNYLDAAGTPSGPGTLGSNFEIDGDLQKVEGADTTDWDELIGSPGFVNEPDQVTGQSDNAFGKGSKEDTNPPSVVTGSIPKNKSDLTNFLFNQEIVDGNVFLEVGFIRANTLGTANMDFEFNQSGTKSNNGVTPNRTVGDILISFDFASGGNLVDLSLREWDGAAWSSAMDLYAAGAAEGAVNNGFSVANPLGDPDPLADKTFGEAVINLTQVFGDECRSFASAFVKSRSSDSFTSALKDFIAPIFVNINACQTIELPNTAAADATNHAPGPVSDDGLIIVTNDPDLVPTDF